jgi:hypothetical protein
MSILYTTINILHEAIGIEAIYRYYCSAAHYSFVNNSYVIRSPDDYKENIRHKYVGTLAAVRGRDKYTRGKANSHQREGWYFC